jgi:hypothetical protein
MLVLADLASAVMAAILAQRDPQTLVVVVVAELMYRMPLAAMEALGSLLFRMQQLLLTQQVQLEAQQKQHLAEILFIHLRVMDL